MQQYQDQEQGPALQQGERSLTPEQTRLAVFESNAAKILLNIARSSRFILAESVNQPAAALPFMPGEEVDAAVVGTLPGGRVFVQVAGTSLELVLPRVVQPGEILRLTYISSLPKPLFALQRSTGEMIPSSVSEAGRWLSVLEHEKGGPSGQQLYVLERLNAVLTSLPPDSPAFSAILDEAITYQTVMRGRRSDLSLPGSMPDGSQDIQVDSLGRQSQEQAGAAVIQAAQTPLQQGNGIVLNDDMAKLLQALIKGNRLALLEAINQQAMPMGLSPGQQLKGEVIALLGGGRFMVQVADQSLQFIMPKGTQRGDLVNLFFITDEPTPTFLMARFGRPGDSQVSETGHWLSGFIGATSERMPAREALGILRTLLAEPPAEASQVGKMLQQGLRESGLFYESHLARWFGGDYPLEDILREPQGLLSRLRLPASVAQTAEAAAADALARASMKTGSLEVMEAMFRRLGTGPEHDGIADQRSLPVIHEQLDSLQSGQIIYRGELFPGQPMEWSIGEREARQNASGRQGRVWDTRLSLDLPKLGAISVRLTLDGSRVSIDLRAGEADSAVLLEGGRPGLVEQLQSAGLIPTEIGISHGAP
jgi:hypothetical protein